jgi:hypothetical protein
MSLIARIDGLRRAASRFPISLLEFGMRLAVGATFFRSGMNKAEDFSNAIVLFREEYRLLANRCPRRSSSSIAITWRSSASATAATSRMSLTGCA